MLNKIITGISQKLDEEFNTEENQEYTIYTENVEQGLEEPCFFIFSLKPSSKQLVGNRYERKYPFDIHFFPDTELVDG
ncbi:phage tail terminator family protein, partial [Clostridium neonatale]|uniref:phage tail terminator family protein n=1 Tax=Clostridium neonatale TaxID=137838 RepID=UPI003D33B236